jgi:hypothetical protein
VHPKTAFFLLLFTTTRLIAVMMMPSTDASLVRGIVSIKERQPIQRVLSKKGWDSPIEKAVRP